MLVAESVRNLNSISAEQGLPESRDRHPSV